MAVSVDVTKLLDKDYQKDLSLADLLKTPVEALSGVSAGDAEKLKEAFNIKTIGDLGRNKYFRAAAALVDLETAAG
ncbi:hypothetical protein ACVGVM_13025 [Pseudonocardia bannensis]|uniref:Uncharacterized protein n=1 Tax=Pseudonocardia bannensis TaxID=630973 RepID=A0A848DIP2_9PSEU|nr:hypothetical protein [Pseudonocardia bannensis]NMH92572.1 hypothetical protein [Pseudonocardia bannensis]